MCFFFFITVAWDVLGGKQKRRCNWYIYWNIPFWFFLVNTLTKINTFMTHKTDLFFLSPPPDPFPTLYSCIRVFNALTSEFVVVCGSVDVGRSHQLKGVHKTIGFAIMPYISCTKLLERRIRLISRRVISWRFIIFCFVYVSHAISIPFTDKMTHAWVSRKHFNFFICVWGVYIVLG